MQVTTSASDVTHKTWNLNSCVPWQVMNDIFTVCFASEWFLREICFQHCATAVYPSGECQAFVYASECMRVHTHERIYHSKTLFIQSARAKDGKVASLRAERPLFDFQDRRVFFSLPSWLDRLCNPDGPHSLIMYALKQKITKHRQERIKNPSTILHRGYQSRVS
jgi:hypothetical protein